VYPDDRIVPFISSNFIPVKIHIQEQPQAFKRFGAQWTPTLLVMTPDGEEAHRIEGFLGVEDLLAQLELGLGKVLLRREKYRDAENRFRTVAQTSTDPETASEAMYWAGVAAYKVSHDGGKLKETYQALHQRFPSSQWARKAVVWAG